MTKKQAFEYLATKYNEIKIFVYQIDENYFKMKGQYHEDITHDLYLKLYNELEKLENDPSVINKFLDRFYDSGTFKLYTVVRNMYIDMIRKEKKYINSDDNEISMLRAKRDKLYHEQPEVILDSEKSIDQMIDSYVDTFYWFDARVFNLYRYEFKNHTSNMSKETKLSVSTIYRTVKRCKVKINEKLKDQYYEK